jgi:hypothetical protein
MNTISRSLRACAVLLLAGGGAHAYDSDPGYGQYAPTRSQASNSRPSQTAYYKPTQIYYGKGYTIAYNYAPVSQSTSRRPTEITPQPLLISPTQIAAYGLTDPKIKYVSTPTRSSRRSTNSVAGPMSPAPAAPPPIATGPGR